MHWLQSRQIGSRGGYNRPTLIGVTSNAITNSASSIVVTTPAGAADGDLLIGLACCDGPGSRTWTDVGGWTERLDSSAAPNTLIRTFVVSGSPPANHTFTCSSNQRLTAALLCFRNGVYGGATTQATATVDVTNQSTTDDGITLGACTFSGVANTLQIAVINARSPLTPRGAAPVPTPAITGWQTLLVVYGQDTTPMIVLMRDVPPVSPTDTALFTAPENTIRNTPMGAASLVIGN